MPNELSKSTGYKLVKDTDLSAVKYYRSKMIG